MGSWARQLKRLALESLRRCQRGALGEIALRFNDRSDQLVDLKRSSELVGISTSGGSLRLNSAELERQDGRGAGIQLDLPAGQRVTQLIPLITG